MATGVVVLVALSFDFEACIISAVTVAAQDGAGERVGLSVDLELSSWRFRRKESSPWKSRLLVLALIVGARPLGGE